MKTIDQITNNPTHQKTNAILHRRPLQFQLLAKKKYPNDHPNRQQPQPKAPSSKQAPRSPRIIHMHDVKKILDHRYRRRIKIRTRLNHRKNPKLRCLVQYQNDKSNPKQTHVLLHNNNLTPQNLPNTLQTPQNPSLQTHCPAPY